jgi:3'-phosphoadenosine 5'-phosphosulfate sulfotransferase (PAPS reductase)/FAD synthetase
MGLPITRLSVVSPKNKINVDLSIYDQYIIFFSAGKDSLACILWLIEQGVDKDKIELHHHLIDGSVDEENFMDWPVTSAYGRAVAEALGVSYVESWREGGFKGEMLRENERTKPVRFETKPGELIAIGGVNGKLNTRRKFPQVTGSLAQRWCSSSLKIDVGSAYLRNDEKFIGKKTLVITGERAQESNQRAGYLAYEKHRSDLRGGKKYQRHIDHLRPVHQWSEKEVWEIIEKHKINPHPAYWVGFGRCSCITCIFGSKNQWATIREIANDKFNEMSDYEKEFNLTINREFSVDQMADMGTPYPYEEKWAKIAMREDYNEQVILDTWYLPPGAYGESNGPV